MSEYISKEWLKEHIEVISYEGMWHETETDEFVSVENIDSAPSIDIVRCGECKWRKAKMMPKSVKCLFSGKADDFCSYGQKGDENVETD